MVTNPLSARARGIIYVTAIVIGAVSLVATAILNVINLEQWVSVVAAAASAAAPSFQRRVFIAQLLCRRESAVP